jgi:basic membrane protein A
VGRRQGFRWVAAASALLVVAAACGDDSGTADTTESTALGAGMKVCEVADTGGIHDGSFNETAWEGAQRAQEDLGMEATFLESPTADDYAPNIQAFLDDDCDLIVTVGYRLGDATQEAATAHPDQDLTIVDYRYDDPPGNVRQLTFATDEAAFLAGYLAAGMTATGKVATFGGEQLPTVTIFMDGFARGVELYNQRKGTSVEVLGWDVASQQGSFTGDFEDQEAGTRLTRSFVDAGADIVMPVAGPVGVGALAAARDADGVSVIWVDTDGCEAKLSAPDCDLILTSVEKKMDNAVFDTAQLVADGTFAGGLYTGTLENDGVGIAPYHDFEAAGRSRARRRRRRHHTSATTAATTTARAATTARSSRPARSAPTLVGTPSWSSTMSTYRRRSPPGSPASPSDQPWYTIQTWPTPPKNSWPPGPRAKRVDPIHGPSSTDSGRWHGPVTESQTA